MRTREQISKDLQACESRTAELHRELRDVAKAEESAAIAEGKANGHGYWRSDGSCSYCGSMTCAEAIRRLKAPGTTYSGADWKYGWPHKFYIEAGGYPTKFYNAHLSEASPEEFAEFAELSKALFDVIWQRDEAGIKYKACTGIQRHGTVGIQPGDIELR